MKATRPSGVSDPTWREIRRLKKEHEARIAKYAQRHAQRKHLFEKGDSDERDAPLRR